MAKKRTLSGIVRRLACPFDLTLRRLTIRPDIVMCAPEVASIPANRVTQKLGYQRSPEVDPRIPRREGGPATFCQYVFKDC